jgi:hypothetical protein
MGWPPRASMERTDRMLVFMGPVSLVICRQQRVTLPPLLQWLAQERNWVWIHGPASRRAVDCVGSPFSREQWLSPLLLMMAQKVAICGLCEMRMFLDHTQTEHGKRVVCWSGFPL